MGCSVTVRVVRVDEFTKSRAPSIEEAKDIIAKGGRGYASAEEMFVSIED